MICRCAYIRSYALVGLLAATLVLIGAQLSSAGCVSNKEHLVFFPGDYVARAFPDGQDWNPCDFRVLGTKIAEGHWELVLTNLRKGSYQFKVSVGGTWDENYGKFGMPGGDNLRFRVPHDNARTILQYRRKGKLHQLGWADAENHTTLPEAGTRMSQGSVAHISFPGTYEAFIECYWRDGECKKPSVKPTPWDPAHPAVAAENVREDLWRLIARVGFPGTYRYLALVDGDWEQQHKPEQEEATARMSAEGDKQSSVGGNDLLYVPFGGVNVTLWFNETSKKTWFETTDWETAYSGKYLRAESIKGHSLEWLAAPISGLTHSETIAGRPVSNLRTSTTWYGRDIVRLRVGPSHGAWEPPVGEYGVLLDDLQFDSQPSADANLAVDTIAGADKSHGVVIRRKTSSPDDRAGFLFDSANCPLFFSTGHWALNTWLPPDAQLFGLGERVGPLRLEHGLYNMFNTDQGTPADKPLYGTHAFIMEMRAGLAHGLWMLNTAPMEVEVVDGELRYRGSSGIIDLFVFAGSKPSDVILQYQQLIGKPYLPPLWALGWHQCRYGFKDIDEVDMVLRNFHYHDFPLDVLWMDIDYMKGWRDFTADPEKFPITRIRELKDQLSKDGRKLVTILDPGIKVEKTYDTYKRAIQQDVFIKTPAGDTPTLAKVWPGIVHFPDFNEPRTHAWWADEISRWRAESGIDGLWTDMNEPVSFCDGRCLIDIDEEEHENLFTCACSKELEGAVDFNNPGFLPMRLPGVCRSGAGEEQPALDCTTISMKSKHTDGTEHINLHSLYGHQMAAATKAALEADTHQRAFVLTRSTFSGTGRHVAHWLGDNEATWSDMRKSIPGMLAMNLFGIPLVGADVCGFNGDTTDELCARWTQLGALSPFARNHNAIGAKAQEPYRFGPAVAGLSKIALRSRYHLLPYWYTLFFTAHRDGGAVLLPLFHEFPDDTATFNINSQFLIGPALLAAPVLHEGATSVSAYLPQGDWYYWYSGELMADAASSPTYVEVNAPLTANAPGAPMFARGGYVVPTQQPALSSATQVGAPYTYRVALDRAVMTGGDCTGATGCVVAVGDLVVDDGVSLKTLESGDFTRQEVTVTARSANDQWAFRISALSSGVKQSKSQHVVEKLVLHGVPCRDGTTEGDSVAKAKSHYKAATSQVSTVELQLPSDQVGHSIHDNFDIVYVCPGGVAPGRRNLPASSPMTFFGASVSDFRAREDLSMEESFAASLGSMWVPLFTVAILVSMFLVGFGIRRMSKAHSTVGYADSQKSHAGWTRVTERTYEDGEHPKTVGTPEEAYSSSA